MLEKASQDTKKNYKEVILLGTAPSRHDCPFDCEVWGVNGVYTMQPHQVAEGKPFRLDKLFTTDTTFSPEGNLHFDIDVMHKIKKKYGTEYISMNPIGFGKIQLKATPYPWKEIVEKFKTLYFTSSVCHMIAYALYLNYDKLRLYGIDMASKSEYMMQKGGVEYWLGRAEERGCEVFISKGSVLLVPPTTTPYGIKQHLDMKLLDPNGLMDKKGE